ncbi:MFS general substrate transporter [Trametes versicolor FP-101664 SS1]|uniref:MFS general substrate transporter n=1 Tax=Trametes versicolor (strain FP-101664) TaxID=717944 RepID=UPI0004623D47|nr:MFS general substrate transporter [Trametes versicolor FP-101664 SS1]EIW60283.1 MFS general substrate transporter [Trametes versicolor FP-101664 SS1]
MSAEHKSSSSLSEDRRDVTSPDVEKQYNLAPYGNSEGGDYKLRFPNIDEAKVVRKIDLRVVPVLCVLYLLAFLDRVNISNAAVFGLKQDLNLGGNQFNTALVVFFAPYVLFEIPSNALLKHFKPHVWLSLCMFLFGLITLLQGFVQGLSGLIATRFFLGVVESGVFPACFYLIAMWYKRAEAQKRYSFFFSSTTLAGGFGGLLASAIGKMDGLHGFRGWRWIFILEGLVTCLASIVLYFTISDFPEEVAWLSAEEKEFVKARLYEDVGHSKRHDPLTVKSVLEVFKDWKIIVGGFMYFGLIVPAYGYAYFAPSIIQSLGNGMIRTQLLSVPPWACAFTLAMLTATVSDWTRMRFVFVLIPTAIALVGFIILLVVHDNAHLQYAALFLAAMGTYSAMPIIVCWFNTNLGGHHRRAVGTAFQVGFGNIGGIIAVFAFLTKDAPKYIPGYSICIAFICVSVLANTVYFLGVSWENRRRDKLQAQGAYDHLSQDEKKRMGDLNPDYRYFR